MPNAAAPARTPDASGWLLPAAAIVLAITAGRIAALAFSQADLFVDEAQYWLWGQEFAFGYYSKPPLIAWMIRGATDLGGSDAAFWIRLPAPLCHAATAMILGGAAARVHGRAAGIAVVAAFATLPMVALGSLLISTDTVMFPFLALALAGWLRLLEPAPGPRPALAALTGAALGLAFLGKYAAVYMPVLAAVAALAAPAARPRGSDAGVAAAALILVAAPNLAWNLMNGLATLSHTVDNTGLRAGADPRPGAMARFLAEQFVVFGPVLFAALLLLPLRRARDAMAGPGGVLLWLSLPIVAVVTGQALLQGANANWAAAAFLPATLAVVPWLLASAPRLLALSFVVNGVVALALPLAATNAERLRLGADRPLLSRYLGIDELSRAILAEAAARGAATVAATERAVLASLFHEARADGPALRAWPTGAPPRNHYEMRHTLAPEDPGPVLAVTRGDRVPPCATGRSPYGTLRTDPGTHWRGADFRLWLVAPDCWGPE